MTTFTTLRAANLARQAEWDPDDRITLAYRGNELGGECGEAQNIIKKLERERLGIRGSRATVQDLADELADVVICADLIAMAEGVDLDAAVAAKFNQTSEKNGLLTRLTAPSTAASFDVEAYVAEYEFRADGEGGCYTPNEKERALLIDAIHGALSELSLAERDAERSHRSAPHVEDGHCDICGQAIMGPDLCATDIDMGPCHAACLEGSSIVSLETGEALPDATPRTYRWDDLPVAKPDGAAHG